MKDDYPFGSRLTGLKLVFFPVRELRYCQIFNRELEGYTIPYNFGVSNISSSTMGWVGGENRKVETWLVPSGILLRVEGGSDFCISQDGQNIITAGNFRKGDDDRVDNEPDSTLTALDREILLGPALVLALAMCGTWCLHGSAAVFGEGVFTFLGESGQGKSTLATYLSQNTGWQLMADDILPVTDSPRGLTAWPHFPQLKLPMDTQPAVSLPEQLPLDIIFELIPTTNPDVLPDAQLLSPEKAVKVLLSHTAGSRLFGEKILKEHLAFCARAVGNIPIYQLTYPHSRDALPRIREVLESLCSV